MNDKDLFAKALKALVLATDVTRPVEPVAQEWYQDADYSMDDCSDAITEIVHTAISRVQAVRVNTWKQHCEEGTSKAPVHPRTRHIIEVQVIKSKALGGRLRIIFTHNSGFNGVYGREVTASSYRRLVNIIGPMIFSDQATVHFPDMDKQNWVAAVRKKQAPVPCLIHECCCRCVHQVRVIDIDSDDPIYNADGCTYWLEGLNKVHIGNFAHGPGDCDGYTEKEQPEATTSKAPVHPTTTIGTLPFEVLFNPVAASVSIYDPHDQSEVILGFEELADLWGWVNEQMQNTNQEGW